MADTCEFCGVFRAHKRLVCGAQVARLEAAIRAKDAALKPASESWHSEHHKIGLPWEKCTMVSCTADRAALSDQGEDWLPPRAIHDFIERVNRRAEAEMQRTGTLEGAHHRAIEAELAALDELKVE